jgi:uncharacterized membrane protein YeiH
VDGVGPDLGVHEFSAADRFAVTQQVPTSLHELPAWVDVIAMAVGAVFGAHVARGRHIPLFGVILAGMVGGLGGGIARDLLLGLEPAAIANWYYVPAVLAAAVLGGLTARQVSLSLLPFVATQAVALGLLITIGVQKAVAYHTPGASAVLIGVVAATTGGALVDLLTSRPVTIMGEGPGLLGVVACGAVIFWLLTIYVGFYPAVAVTVVGVGSVRVLSVRFGWTTPFFPGDEPRGRRSEPESNTTNR